MERIFDRRPKDRPDTRPTRIILRRFMIANIAGSIILGDYAGSKILVLFIYDCIPKYLAGANDYFAEMLN